jgi:F0F1-type ATP synthase assembly protein I
VADGVIMPRDTRSSLLERSLSAFRSTVVEAGPAAGAGYTLVGAILVLGGLGYGLDAWWGTHPWGLLIGLALGIVIGFYELVKTTWHR